jgi:hypothetical protein
VKKVAIRLILILVAVSTAAVGGRTAADRAAAEQPAAAENAATQGAAQTSPLDQLAWLVGRWVDEGKESTVSSDCCWTKNRKFLVRSITITIDGQPSMEVTERIGWDPIEKRIRSWVFDSEGGFGEGRWIEDGNRWLVKTSFVLADAQRASAVHVFTYVDPNTFRWKSIDREIGGELQPSIPEVTVVRQKPEKPEPQEGGKEASR